MASGILGSLRRGMSGLLRSYHARPHTKFPTGPSCWMAVIKAGCSHIAMATGTGKQAVSWTPFNWVNTCLGNVETAIAGTYHHASAKHAQSYLTSFAYRFNRRYQITSGGVVGIRRP